MTVLRKTHTAPVFFAILLLSGCSSTQQATPGAGGSPAAQPQAGQPGLTGYSHAPDFATLNFEPFNRQDVVAIALREWRLFGMPVNDDDPELRPEPQTAAIKPERAPGLWQRVGEYWWTGQDPYATEASWTGKHNSSGSLTNFVHDGRFAWSAAFISYVMRVAGANGRFVYSPNHATYINAAASGQASGLKAQDPALYAPKPGDLLCVGRGASRKVRFSDLPTSYGFPAHCGIVVATGQNGQPFGRQLSIIGGNIDDAVALTHVPTDANGMVSSSSGQSYDSRYPWCAVLEVIYDAETEPDAGQ
ncbi:DUF2272 domain-containing protein [Acetobacter sp. AN02]|uniref:DUF2272 domain-containing protein n=1 Tax=Acetobacter sp. AN02 TaxID=2894186 RepID=UPI002434566E|nr:DUF2272 domain-containing protein [Acetobacter sp. AN02]MDG6094440.1 DUF2272 domain-containing protein [Acetobacter sp. AN02]